MLALYTISDSYVEFLRVTKGFSKVYDPKITNRINFRPYIGIVLVINGRKYFAPLSSPKRNDYDGVTGAPRKSTASIIRIVTPDNTVPGGMKLLGTITLNNMIPVPDGEMQLLDINSISDIQYQTLLSQELRWIAHNDTAICTKATNLYMLKIHETTRRTIKNGPTLDATIDFAEIEKAHDEWANATASNMANCGTNN